MISHQRGDGGKKAEIKSFTCSKIMFFKEILEGTAHRVWRKSKDAHLKSLTSDKHCIQTRQSKFI